MRKLVIVFLVLGIVGVLGYLIYEYKNTKQKQTDDPTPPLPPVTVKPPTAMDKIYYADSGEGLAAVTDTVAKITANPDEVVTALKIAGINPDSIFDGTNNDLFRNPIMGSGVQLPLVLTPVKKELLLSGSKLKFSDGSLWPNVDRVLSSADNFKTKTGIDLLPLINSTTDRSNKFVDNYPCKISNCKSNDKKRNEEVQKNGSMRLVVENYATLMGNYYTISLLADKAVQNYAIQKLRNAGWNFPGI